MTLFVKRSGDGIECGVEDTGIGISRSDQPRVFDRFFRSEDYRTRQTGGFGLGLYLVKKLTDKLGIKLLLESELNKGSRFSIHIPEKYIKHPMNKVIAGPPKA